MPPNRQEQSCPSVKFVLFPIGGFCAASRTLPLPQVVETELNTRGVDGNGMNVAFNETMHCIAAEPHATFLRASVLDGWHEVAHETTVLGRLRPGYRVLQLRSPSGTRIELSFLFVHISLLKVPNTRLTPRQLRMTGSRQRDENMQLREELVLLQRSFKELQQGLESGSKRQSSFKARQGNHKAVDIVDIG